MSETDQLTLFILPGLGGRPGLGRRRPGRLPLSSVVQGACPSHLPTSPSTSFFHQNGNVQDAINANVVSGRHFGEKEMVRIFKGACEAVRAMHDHHTGSNSGAPAPSSSSSSSRPRGEMHHRSDDEDEDELLPHPEGDGGGGYSYPSSVNVPLVTKRRIEDGDAVYGGGDEALPVGQHVPYAHRDIKPGYASPFRSPKPVC